MTLEYEKIRPDLEQMARVTAARRGELREKVESAEATLRRYRTNWTAIDQALETAQRQGDPKFFRAARPFSTSEPLDAAIPTPDLPDRATIIATDGSQILPDRHAPFLYYLVNIGGIVYHHGDGRAPEPFTVPDLVYPETDADLERFTSAGAVNIERDMMEIETLARETVAYRHEAHPLLALLDQRLLYWPIGSAGVAVNRAVTQWNESMENMHAAGALLCGYIDRPETIAVLTLLRALEGLGDPDFDWKLLGRRQAAGGLADRQLFARLLAPGERSAIFTFVSDPNDSFAGYDPAHEVSFFYLNPGGGAGQIARIDLPHWVADNPAAVDAVHALIVDQCRLIGDYPYVLARADEMAVVGRRDAAELNTMLEIIMQRYGVESDNTAKQNSKELARGGKTRHEGF
jgi:hypothetical protein